MLGRFRRFVDELEMKEVPLIGCRYMWSNEREAPTLVKLDRVLCTPDWDMLFPDCLQSHATEMLDHCPRILGFRDGVKGKRRFHFESFWPQLPGFHEAVAASWEETVDAPCPLERFSFKLKRLSRALQSWSHRQVGHIKKQLQLAKEILHRLEIAQDSRCLSPDEKWLRGELKRQCLGLASLEQTMARLRSRNSWLQEGDANTSFFRL